TIILSISHLLLAVIVVVVYYTHRISFSPGKLAPVRPCWIESLPTTDFPSLQVGGPTLLWNIEILRHHRSIDPTCLTDQSSRPLRPKLTRSTPSTVCDDILPPPHDAPHGKHELIGSAHSPQCIL